MGNKYLLLTEIEVGTVSYGPSFSRRFMALARSARAINQWEKRGSVTYSTDRENEVSKIVIKVNQARGKGKETGLEGRTVE